MEIQGYIQRELAKSNIDNVSLLNRVNKARERYEDKHGSLSDADFHAAIEKSVTVYDYRDDVYNGHKDFESFVSSGFRDKLTSGSDEVDKLDDNSKIIKCYETNIARHKLQSPRSSLQLTNKYLSNEGIDDKLVIRNALVTYIKDDPSALKVRYDLTKGDAGLRLASNELKNLGMQKKDIEVVFKKLSMPAEVMKHLGAVLAHTYDSLRPG